MYYRWIKLSVLMTFLLILAGVSFKTTYAQATDVEPNNSCATSQDLGTVTLPLVVDGELDASAPAGDVDFYEFRGTAGEMLEITLAGEATGDGTLSDPFLGLFNVDCQNLGTSDDWGDSSNSRILVTVPRSGVLVVGAAICCDYDFRGYAGVGGSYRLQVARLPLIGSIAGRVVDNETGEPLTTWYRSGALHHCEGSDCSNQVRDIYIDENGRFLITPTTGYYYYEEPLLAGNYQIVLQSPYHESFQTEIFTVGDGEDLDLGDLTLIQLLLSDSISGQLVDSVTGNPAVDPYYYYYESYVILYRCNETGCSDFIGQKSLDENGYFQFTNAEFYHYGNPLAVGDYQLVLTAIGYETRETEIFSISEGEALDLGQLEMTSLPRADSISGQVVDAVTGDPITGQEHPYAHVTLQECVTSTECYGMIHNAQPASDGTFFIDRADFGVPLLTGTYQLIISAYEYQSKFIVFELDEGEALNLGTIRLEPDPIKLTNFRPCSDLPVRGGRCRFSIQVTNRMRSRLNGVVWATVNNGETGSFLGYTEFTLKNPQKLSLASGRNKQLQFQLDVPAQVSGSICIDIFVAKGSNDPFDTIGHESFCIYKQQNVY